MLEFWNFSKLELNGFVSLCKFVVLIYLWKANTTAEWYWSA